MMRRVWRRQLERWRPKLKRFGLRFGICLVVLGGLYLAIFGLHPTSHNTPLSATQKIAGLGAALDETYIDNSTLAGFNQSSTVASATLGTTFSQFQAAHASLQTALKAAPTELTPPIRQQLRTVLSREAAAASSYTTLNAALSQVVSYDPTADIGNLSLSSDSATIAARALAAQKGLNHAAATQTPNSNVNSDGLDVSTATGGNALLSSSLQSAIQKEASCLGQLATQVNAKSSAAKTTLNSCVAAYPALRQKAVVAIVQTAFGGSYQSYLKQTVPPLLTQLNQLTR